MADSDVGLTREALLAAGEAAFFGAPAATDPFEAALAAQLVLLADDAERLGAIYDTTPDNIWETTDAPYADRLRGLRGDR